MDAETVCTEAQLDEFLGGQLAGQTRLVPSTWANAKPARQWALDRALESLARRRPPIREANIATPSELRAAVEYGAAHRLYDLAATSGSDAELFIVKARDYGKAFRAELEAMQITASGGELQIPGGIRLSRA